MTYMFADANPVSLHVVPAAHSCHSVLLVRVYNGIPFMREMRQLLDWITANTCLDLNEWMIFESMYTDLFLSVNTFQKTQEAPGKQVRGCHAALHCCRAMLPPVAQCVVSFQHGLSLYVHPKWSMLFVCRKLS